MPSSHQLQSHNQLFQKAIHFLDHPVSHAEVCECSCEIASLMPNLCATDINCPELDTTTVLFEL